MKKGMVFIRVLVLMGFSLLVGVLIIWGITSVLNNMFTSSTEEILARDLAVSINALSATQGNAYFRYSPPVEDYIIEIHDDTVTVRSSIDVASASINPLAGLRIDNAIFQDVTSIPIRYSQGRVFFEDLIRSEFESFCEGLPGFVSEQSTFRVTGWRPFREELEEALEAEGFELVSGGADFTINIETNSDSESLIINYYNENPDFHKLSCYITLKFRENHENNFLAFQDMPSSNRELKIILGGTSPITQNNQLINPYTGTIVDAIKEVSN